ncbi:MAG TPA: 16S rRNA (cytosine(967)-C(5))-methyltransferase RsmB [Gammaproteobacteria bacterium]|nr:16S rRNA (cytosine(967)-C(5))-methyltransferase RsmB [Gammaproteobacteria bacterium]
MNIRAAAAIILCDVLSGTSLSDTLPKHSAKFKDARDQAFLHALCYGVCRWYFRLAALLNTLLDKPIKEKDQDIYCLLLVGLYQLMEMRVPPHAAIAETVNAAKALKKIWAKGLVNAVLRHYQRRLPESSSSDTKDLSVIYSHPAWMIEMAKKDWPLDWQDILAANNQHPPFSLRVNQKKISREKYIEKLKDAETQVIAETEGGITLLKPCDVTELPGFSEGEISVQDGASQLAAGLLSVQPGQRVLDACAAPGGKTTHILELASPLQKMIAIDHHQERLNSIRENLERLHLTADLICADAGNVPAWWDGVLFDRILLDAPCSASGVIRRHPDIKLLRNAEDISRLAKEQSRLLENLWTVLKPDGLLVYATCSVYALENTEILTAFIAAHQDAKEEKIKTDWGKECIIGRQILPGMHGMDGFYFAVLKKR